MAERVLYNVHSDFYPDDSDNCWPEDASVLQANGLYFDPVIRIDADRNNDTAIAQLAGFYARFQVPAEFSSGGKLRVWWVSTKTAGDVRWHTFYNAIAKTGESFDPAASASPVEVTATTAATAWHINMTELSLTGLSAEDFVRYFLGNDGTDAADTLAGARIILAVDFVFDDGA